MLDGIRARLDRYDKEIDARKTYKWGGFYDAMRAPPISFPPDTLKPGKMIRFDARGEFTSEQLNYGGMIALEYFLKQTEKPSMKPGPYKSSTHGNIMLSVRGRELLQAEREAVTAALNSIHESWTPSISRARGELAKYISELEARAFPASPVSVSLDQIAGPLTELCMHHYDVAADLMKRFGVERASQLPSHRLPELLVEVNAALARATRPEKYAPMPRILDNKALIPLHLKFTTETDMKCDTNLPRAADKPIEKTRSRLWQEASDELCAAQRALEQLLAADPKAPKSIYLRDGGQMGWAIAPLILEQWGALVKKATVRAKARVAKAEKAVSALLAK